MFVTSSHHHWKNGVSKKGRFHCQRQNKEYRRRVKDWEITSTPQKHIKFCLCVKNGEKDEPSRWNSTLHMVKWLREQKLWFREQIL
ncbi:hypothetical protein PR048_029194, partial [Dryococelus australis]